MRAVYGVLTQATVSPGCMILRDKPLFSPGHILEGRNRLGHSIWGSGRPTGGLGINLIDVRLGRLSSPDRSWTPDVQHNPMGL